MCFFSLALYSVGDSQNVILSKDYSSIALDTITYQSEKLPQKWKIFKILFVKKMEIINRNNEKNGVAVMILPVIRLHPMHTALLFAWIFY